MSTEGRRKLSTRNLAAASVVAAAGVIAAPAAADAHVRTWFTHPSGASVCESPGWVGAVNRSPISVSVWIHGGNRCTTNSFLGWVHAWIHDSTGGFNVSTGTQHGQASTGFFAANHDHVRDFAKLNSRPTNATSHFTKAFSSRTP
jgi:hypothetical protein